MQNKIRLIVLEKGNTKFSSYPLKRELEFLDICLQHLEEQIKHLIDQQDIRFKNKYENALMNLDDGDPNFDNYLALLEDAPYQHKYKMEIIIPALLRNFYLVQIYTLFERWIENIADYIAKREEKKIKLKNIKGSFLNQVNNWYKDNVDLNIYADGELEKLTQIYKLRNTIVHQLSNTYGMNQQEINGLSNIVASEPKLEMNEGFLIVKHGYLENSLCFIESILARIVDCLKEKYEKQEEHYKLIQQLNA